MDRILKTFETFDPPRAVEVEKDDDGFSCSVRTTRPEGKIQQTKGMLKFDSHWARVFSFSPTEVAFGSVGVFSQSKSLGALGFFGANGWFRGS